MVCTQGRQPLHQLWEIRPAGKKRNQRLNEPESRGSPSPSCLDTDRGQEGRGWGTPWSRKEVKTLGWMSRTTRSSSQTYLTMATTSLPYGQPPAQAEGSSCPTGDLLLSPWTHLSLTTLMVLMPEALAIWITAWPTPLLAAFWMTESPACEQTQSFTAGMTGKSTWNTLSTQQSRTWRQGLKVSQHAVRCAGVDAQGGSAQHRDVTGHPQQHLLREHSLRPPRPWVPAASQARKGKGDETSTHATALTLVTAASPYVESAL